MTTKKIQKLIESESDYTESMLHQPAHYLIRDLEFYIKRQLFFEDMQKQDLADSCQAAVEILKNIIITRIEGEA